MKLFNSSDHRYTLTVVLPAQFIAIADALVEELKLAHAKIKMLAECMETEDGIFTFPDGDYVETKKIKRFVTSTPPTVPSPSPQVPSA